MVLFGMLLIMICLLVDVVVQIPLGPLVLKLQLVSLFLFFLLFRKSLRHIVIVLLFYLLVLSPFTSLCSIPVFFSFFVILVFVHRLRAQIYTESYLVQSLWVFAMSLFQQIILSVMMMKGWSISFASITMLNIFVNSLILAFITVTFFITWDRWYDFIEKIFLTRSAG